MYQIKKTFSVLCCIQTAQNMGKEKRTILGYKLAIT